MGVIVSILCGFIPAFLFAGFVYWLDRYEKEPKLLLGGVFLWGAIVASAGAFIINTLFGVGIYSLTGSERAADLTTSTLSAPIVEESLKGFAVLLVFLLARKEFDSILDGIVYAAVTALGFSATENAYYIYSYGFAEKGWTGLAGMTIVRVILVGWQHPFYTSFLGIGLAVARLYRGCLAKIAAPLAGLALAIFTHSFHNTLASFTSGAGTLLGFLIDWTGWLAMFIFILIMTYREKRWIQEFLREEVGSGTLSVGQYQTASSALRQFLAGFTALSRGNLRNTRRFYQLCAELSHKKHQYAILGDEKGNSATITTLRAEITQLASHAATG